MAAQEWTVKQLIKALKKFPLDAKAFFEMGTNGAGTIGKAQYVKARGEDDQLGVPLDRLSDCFRIGKATGNCRVAVREREATHSPGYSACAKEGCLGYRSLWLA